MSRRRMSSDGGQRMAQQPLEKRLRLPQTCEWILREPAYLNWKHWDEGVSPLLWILGPAGIGKSVLGQFIVDDLKDAVTTITLNTSREKSTGDSDDKVKRSITLECFCNISSTPSTIVRTLLSQLLASPSIDQTLRAMVTSVTTQIENLVGNEKKQGDSSDLSVMAGVEANSLPRLWDLLVKVVETAPPLTLVVDGLDELSSQYLQTSDLDCAALLVDLAAVPAANVRVLLLSRSDAVDVRRAIGSSPRIQVTAEKVREDIKLFTDAEINKYPRLEESSFKRELRDEIVDQADGSFVWAALTVQALADVESGDLQEQLESIQTLSSPASLQDLYAGVLARQADHLTPSRLALRDIILRWIVLAVRPMHSAEIANAIAVETGALLWDIESEGLALCSSALVKVEKGVFLPAHHSLRDFLASNHPAVSGADNTLNRLSPSDESLRIAKTLLSYLTHPGLLLAGSAGDFAATHPLAEYAALYWVHHVSQSREDVGLQEQIRQFFRTDGCAVCWFDVLLPAYISRSLLPVPPRPPINSRFLHLFMLKSQLVNYFPVGQRQEIDDLIRERLRTEYERLVIQTTEKHGLTSKARLQRLLELSELYGWLTKKEFQKQAAVILDEAVGLAERLSSEDPGDAEVKGLTIAALQARADALKRDGQYAAARDIFERLLRIADAPSSVMLAATTGSDQATNAAVGGMAQVDANSRTVVFILDSLGWTLMRLDGLREAEATLRRAAAMAQQCFGTRSPVTVRATVTLAEVLGKLGRPSEAAEICADIRTDMKRRRRDGLPLPLDAVSHLNTLAMIYTQEGHYREAMDAWQFVAEERSRMFGKDSRMTLGAEMKLAEVMFQAGEAASGRQVLDGLLPRQERVLGREHRDVREAKKLLGSVQT